MMALDLEEGGSSQGIDVRSIKGVKHRSRKSLMDSRTKGLNLEDSSSRG